MKTQLLVGLGILFAALAGCSSSEPTDYVHKGKPVSAWTKALKSDSAQARREAAEALAEMPPKAAANAIPALMELSRDPDKITRCRVAEAMAHITTEIRIPLPLPTMVTPEIAKLLDDEDAEVRRAAARALGRFGPAAVKSVVVPALTKSLQDPDELTRQAAAAALEKIGPESPDQGPRQERDKEPAPAGFPGFKGIPQDKAAAPAEKEGEAEKDKAAPPANDGAKKDKPADQEI